MQFLCDDTLGWHNPNEVSFEMDMHGYLHVHSVSEGHLEVVL